jgi:hypothetical protein
VAWPAHPPSSNGVLIAAPASRMPKHRVRKHMNSILPMKV